MWYNTEFPVIKEDEFKATIFKRMYFVCFCLCYRDNSLSEGKMLSRDNNDGEKHL